MDSSFAAASSQPRAFPLQRDGGGACLVYILSNAAAHQSITGHDRVLEAKQEEGKVRLQPKP